MLKHLIILAGNILYDLFHRTAEDPAQVIDGGGVTGLSFRSLSMVELEIRWFLMRV